MKRLFWPSLAGVLALAVSTCAPTNHSSTQKSDAAADANVPTEVITRAPTPVADPTRNRIEAAIDNVRQRDLLTSNGFWTIFHGILGLGPAVTLRDPTTDIRLNAVDYISGGGSLRGLQFIPTKHGLDVQMGPLMVGQGHQDQYVAEMAQWGMPAERKFLVFGKEYTFMDFVRHSQMRARVNGSQELDWAVLVIGQYFGTDAAWTNELKEPLRLEDVIRYELDAPIEKAPCGGTHRLFGLAWVQQLHYLRDGSDGPIWNDVTAATNKYRDLAKKYQSADGSFSTDFFRGPANGADAQLRINTTGHTLEWLALALTDKELREPWVQSAANALALQILDLQGAAIEGGSLYHAVHGLLIYYARVYGKEKLGANAPVLPDAVVSFAGEKLKLPKPVVK